MQRSTAAHRPVTSPSESWAQLSSEDALGRRLAEFGEILITRVDLETTVAWEGDRASGAVELEPTGWGTKLSRGRSRTPAQAASDEAARLLDAALHRPFSRD